MTVAVVSGLAFEAKIASGPGNIPIYGLEPAQVAAKLEAAIKSGVRGVISFGTAGGLESALVPGDLVIPPRIVSQNRVVETSTSWRETVLRALASEFEYRECSSPQSGNMAASFSNLTSYPRVDGGPGPETQASNKFNSLAVEALASTSSNSFSWVSRLMRSAKKINQSERDENMTKNKMAGTKKAKSSPQNVARPKVWQSDLYGSDFPIASADRKKELSANMGVVAVDMESHNVGLIAQRYGVPFIALRVVLDPAQRTLPEAALAGTRADGSTNLPAVLTSLAKKPGQLPALIKLASDANRSKTSLLCCRKTLGPLFGFSLFVANSSHFPLNVE